MGFRDRPLCKSVKSEDRRIDHQTHFQARSSWSKNVQINNHCEDGCCREQYKDAAFGIDTKVVKMEKLRERLGMGCM